MPSLASLEIDRHDWAALRVRGGSAAWVPDTLRALLTAVGDEQAQRLHDEFDGRVIARGGLYSAAPAVVSVLCGALLDPEPPTGRGWQLALLFLLVDGESSEEERDRGLPDLGHRCRATAREATWALYHELLTGTARWDARDVLQRVETDRPRLRAYAHQAHIPLTDEITNPLDDPT